MTPPRVRSFIVDKASDNHGDRSSSSHKTNTSVRFANAVFQKTKSNIEEKALALPDPKKPHVRKSAMVVGNGMLNAPNFGSSIDSVNRTASFK